MSTSEYFISAEFHIGQILNIAQILRLYFIFGINYLFIMKNDTIGYIFKDKVVKLKRNYENQDLGKNVIHKAFTKLSKNDFTVLNEINNYYLKIIKGSAIPLIDFSGKIIDHFTKELFVEKFSDYIKLTADKIDYESIFDNMPVGIIVLDTKGIITFFNRTYFNLRGDIMRDIVNKPFLAEFPNSKLLDVLHSGKSQIELHQDKVYQNKFIYKATPILKNKNIIGVIITVTRYDVEKKTLKLLEEE